MAWLPFQKLKILAGGVGAHGILIVLQKVTNQNIFVENDPNLIIYFYPKLNREVHHLCLSLDTFAASFLQPEIEKQKFFRIEKNSKTFFCPRKSE